MKKLLNSYLMLSRTERMGYAALTGLLLILVVVWQTMPYFIKPPAGAAAENARLALIYKNWKRVRLVPDESDAPAYNQENRTASLFTFDPNTLDSAGFLRLGLSPKATKGLLNWRAHGKHFYKKEDLKPLYNLTPELYARLEPYISIPPTTGNYGNHYSSYTRLPPLPATLDLNTTDSATLVRLNGIGPVLAHKIIARRQALGGFLNHGQLTEVYKFSDSVFAMLQQRLVIRPEAVHKIAVNSAGPEELQSHPYIGEKMARNIVLYRDALKRFDDLKQLRQVPLMNEEIYRKIAPYLKLD